jgi:hypothetical protein
VADQLHQRAPPFVDRSPRGEFCGFQIALTTFGLAERTFERLGHLVEMVRRRT